MKNIPYVITTQDDQEHAISVPGNIVGAGTIAIIQYAGFRLHDVSKVVPVR